MIKTGNSNGNGNSSDGNNSNSSDGDGNNIDCAVATAINLCPPRLNYTLTGKRGSLQYFSIEFLMLNLRFLSLLCFFSLHFVNLFSF